jgi:hypothetical protein
MLREVADYPNSVDPLGANSERIETRRYTLCLGPGSTWNTVQRQRFPLEELDEVLAEVRAHLRERGRKQTQWEIGSSAVAGLVEALYERGPSRRNPLAFPAERALREGADQNRTGVRGFAGLCLTTRPRRRERHRSPGSGGDRSGSPTA